MGKTYVNATLSTFHTEYKHIKIALEKGIKDDAARENALIDLEKAKSSFVENIETINDKDISAQDRAISHARRNFASTFTKLLIKNGLYADIYAIAKIIAERGSSHYPVIEEAQCF